MFYKLSFNSNISLDMLPTDFMKGVMRLLCLVSLSRSYRIISEADDCYAKAILCPCGNQGYNVTLRVHICTGSNSNSSSKCKSCLLENNAQESCRRFEYCQKCVTGYSKCVSCPSGEKGILCKKENDSPIGYIKKRRKPRDHICEMPPSPSPGRIQCTIDEDKMTCTGTCRTGFLYPDGTSERIHECNNLNGRWSPAEYFPECQPVCYEGCQNGGTCVYTNLCRCTEEFRGNLCQHPVDRCALQLSQPASSYDCSHTPDNSLCRIKCDTSTGYFECSLEGVWTPPLPRCVSSTGVSHSAPTRGTPRCRCQNGGICERGICLCPPDYEGVSCESRKRVHSSPPTRGVPRCRCQNGGICERGTCICPPDYEGVSCESRKTRRCPDLGHLHDGQQVNRGSTIIYSCNRPYQLIGNARINCNSDGTWSAPKPSCVAPPQPDEILDPLNTPLNDPSNIHDISSGDGESNDDVPPTTSYSHAQNCPDLGSLENGQQSVRGDTITYSCNSPYELSGDYTISCNRNDGTWSASKPVCIAQTPRRPSGNCGISDSPRTPYITNGNASNIGQWPWHTAISRYEDSRQAWEIICGASLVSQHYVITAAHCVTRDRSATPIDNNYLTIYLGKYYYSFEKDDVDVQIIYVRQIIIHPKYNPTRFDADIALVRLQTLAEYSSRVHPICLPTPGSTRRNLAEGAIGIVTGWGFDERGRTPDVLQQARIPVVSKRNCEDGYRQAALELTVTENMYCAGYQEGQVDICSGDSGGPMVFLDQSTRTWVLEGVVSWGSVAGCGRSRQYGGYTRVQRFVNWIQEYL